MRFLLTLFIITLISTSILGKTEIKHFNLNGRVEPKFHEDTEPNQYPLIEIRKEKNYLIITQEK